MPRKRRCPSGEITLYSAKRERDLKSLDRHSWFCVDTEGVARLNRTRPAPKAGH
jgi:hypothetical protein